MTSGSVSAAARYSALAAHLRSLALDSAESDILERVVAVALEEVPAASFGGISELHRSVVRTHAASSSEVADLDRAQSTAGEGPSWTVSSADSHVVVSPDLTVDDRWPKLRSAAVGLGARSAMSLKLAEGRDVIGSLNLYARERDVFTLDAEEVGCVLAAHAASVVSALRKQANLAQALASRDVIGQAKGILMERFKISDGEAFELLIAVSQHSHRKLREVADDLRTSGELPDID